MFIFATMKQRAQIAILWVVVVLAACNRPVETRFIASPDPNVSPAAIASPELSAIDSLMWQRPDSALACLLPWFDTCGDAKFCVSTAYDRHYAHLLLAELLYKNDFEQTNRTDLRPAVAYFDSLVWQAPPLPPCKGGWGIKRGPGGLKHTLPNPNDILFFLAARAHYINGVGYYERDSLVEACTEYLAALKTMEGHFAEKALVGKKARFMTYTYNRLGDMFSAQFMMEASIVCLKNALIYYRKAPTSPMGVSGIYNWIGIQYDMIGAKDSAIYYYDRAVEELPDTNSLIYRNILSSKALLSYQMNRDIQLAMKDLMMVVGQTTDENEKLTRYLTIGDIYYEEKQYDSAMFYLEFVFENSINESSRIRAAEFLRKVYEDLGNNEKEDKYVRYLANHKKLEAENKVSVSKLNELFQDYLGQKRERQIEAERKASIRNLLMTAIPIALMASLVVFVLVKHRSRKQLRRQQEQVDKALEEKTLLHEQELEAERRIHLQKQAAMSGRLKKRNQELRELKDQVKQQDEGMAREKRAGSFAEEPVCRLIKERVQEGQFKSKLDYAYYKDYALSKEQILDLRVAADRHFDQFTVRLAQTYPALTKIDLDYCCLYLLGLSDADIAALMQRAYNTVIERNVKLRKIFGSENALPVTLMKFACDFVSQ